MKFSIVTPSFRQLDRLRLCVASVADQACEEAPELLVEHIVQDGGSDGFREWEAELPRERWAEHGAAYCLQLRSESDGGMYDAINRGLKKGTGEVCAWLNCDEQYLPGALARVAAFFRAHPFVEVVFGDALLIGPRFEVLSYRTTVLPTAEHTRLVHLNTLSCSTFFRRSVLERGHWLGDEWRTIGDAVWVERMLRQGVRMERLGVATSAFQFTGQNLGSSGTAAEEVRRWAMQPDAPPRWRRWPARMDLWVRKAFAGGYQKKNVETALYTSDVPTGRVPCTGRNVGFSWPKG